MHRQFTSADVHYIRTSGISDAEMGRILKVTPESVRRVRVGIHYQDHPTPPPGFPGAAGGSITSPLQTMKSRKLPRP